MKYLLQSRFRIFLSMIETLNILRQAQIHTHPSFETFPHHRTPLFYLQQCWAVQIRSKGPQCLPDRPDGLGAFHVYCDQTTAGGG